MHLNNNQIICTMKTNSLIFSHTFSKFREHFCGIKRFSSGEHSKLRQNSTELRSTEKDILLVRINNVVLMYTCLIIAMQYL